MNHALLVSVFVLFENLYKCTGQTVLKALYFSADEIYCRILVQEKNRNGKGVKKGYFWVIVGMKSRMLYLLYDNGARTEDVIIEEVGDYMGYNTE